MATVLEAQAARSRDASQPTMAERGSTLVQTLLILPIFLMIVLGGYEIWKAHSVRESLRSGVYQATRYLSLNADQEEWYPIARNDFVMPELLNNNLVTEEMANQVVVGAVRPPLECGASFVVQADLPWQAVIPFVPDQDLTMHVEYEGEVFCGP